VSGAIDIAEVTRRLSIDGFDVDHLEVLDARHADRPVLRGTVDGRAAVVKLHHSAATAAAGHHAAMAIWAATATGGEPGVVPEPMGWSPSAAAVIGEFVSGSALGARGSIGGAFERAHDVAQLLARLHATSDTGHVARRDVRGIARSTRRKAAELPAPDQGPALAVAAALDAAGRADDADDRLVMTHGDFTPRNLLVEPSGRLRLIDLDRVRLAPAGRDIGYWRAWCWATQLLAGDTARWSHTDPFLAARPAHADGPRGADTIATSLPRHTAAGLIRIAHGWSILATMPELRAAIVDEAAALTACTPAR
jgi:aminoglycoside phosphotransferase (APT) family kinase protein